MKNNKKIKGILIVLAVCFFIEAISMRSYAFFSYEEEGQSGSLAVGKVSVDYEELHSLGNLTKTSQRTSYDAGAYVGFSIIGRNTSANPLYYYITVSEGTASGTSGAVRIRDDLLKFRLVSYPTETDYTNGTNETEIFDNKDFGALKSTIVGTGSIAAGTSTDTPSYYKLYVWINNDVKLCGAKAAGCDYYTIEQYPKWDNVYASIKVGVNASFTQKTISYLYDKIKSGAVSDATAVSGSPINFGARNYKDTADETTQDNGNGKFYMAGTGDNADDLARIYYYRGDIANNNVSFGGFCWKIVRTTDTGGIKMIYNGVYNASTKCNNTNAAGTTSIKEGNTTTFAFNPSYKSVAYMGYSYTKYITMQNGKERTAYEWVANAAPDAGTAGDTTDDASVIFGGDVTYNNGVYTLVNTDVGIATTRHYTCNSTVRTDTCAKVRYYYYDNTTGANDRHYYIELEGGDNVENAIDSMLNHETDTYSNVQVKINNWYRNNLEGNYDAYIEDTVWCMERNRVSRNDGWYPNGGALTTDLWSSALTRANGNHNAIKLSCDGTLTYGSKSYTDYYTNRDESVDQLYYGYGSGNIGSKAALLTYDEVKLAGMKYYTNTTYTHNYLYTGYWYWLLSPANFYGNLAYARAGDVSTGGESDYSNVSFTSGGVRPVVSLNHGTQIYGGTGTATDPYIVTES